MHTPGAVLRPAESVFAIVPQNAPMIVEARMEPNTIDDIHYGSSATVRLPAFNTRTTPELKGNRLLGAATLDRLPTRRLSPDSGGRELPLSQTHAGVPKINRCHRRKTNQIITLSGTPDQHP